MGNYFQVDLKGVSVIPDAYTLRHYDSYAEEGIYNWSLQGGFHPDNPDSPDSPDKSSSLQEEDKPNDLVWVTISNHINEHAFNTRGQMKTWKINIINVPNQIHSQPQNLRKYTSFRVVQTGENVSKHWFLALSGFEIYGKVFSEEYI